MIRCFSALVFSVFLVSWSILAVEPGHGAGKACAECHLSEWQEWSSSHHSFAMQEATVDTVLGDFENRDITINGVTSRFYRKDVEFWVQTENQNGRLQEYQVAFSFGVHPLQQYLVQARGGRYQVLPVAWDARSANDGGQRWYHIYGDETVPHTDRLHWAQPLQNWNGMCADCHSTGLKRGFDIESDTFATNWEQMNVGCKACHGPGQSHSQYYASVTAPFSSPPISGEKIKDYLLTLSPEVDKSEASEPAIDEPEVDAGWRLLDGKKTLTWHGEKRDQSQIEVCAACHSHRTPLQDGFEASDRFLDSFSPSLVLPPLYFSDGQIKEEVYVWGSFQQSKMFSEGVVCSDCHNPHSLQLKAEGNDLCAQCHLPQNFDTTEHHRHTVGSEGGMCANCHMPATTYMGVDARRDHSFRVPHPMRSEETASPNVCTICHNDSDAKWAEEKLRDWYVDEAPTKSPIYGEVLQSVYAGTAGAEAKLKALIKDTAVPEIIRASGLSLLAMFPNRESADYLAEFAASDGALLRLGVARGAAALLIPQKVKILAPLLQDTFRAIRIEAARTLASVGVAGLPAGFHRAYEDAEAELFEAEKQNAWRAEGRVNLAMLHSMRGEEQEAIAHYQAAMAQDPFFTASYVNLADIFRARGDEETSREVLEAGLKNNTEDPSVNYALALYFVRKKEMSLALPYFDRAVSVAPDHAFYAYVYGMALRDLGQIKRALAVLTRAVQVSPMDGNVNFLLVSLHISAGDFQAALAYSRQLIILFPENRQLRQQHGWLMQQAASKTGTSE